MIFGVGWLFALPVARAGELRPVANLFKSPSAPAELGFEASLLALIICAAIFIVVAGLLI